jgi:hypothetical protein
MSKQDLSLASRQNPEELGLFRRVTVGILLEAFLEGFLFLMIGFCMDAIYLFGYVEPSHTKIATSFTLTLPLGGAVYGAIAGAYVTAWRVREIPDALRIGLGAIIFAALGFYRNDLSYPGLSSSLTGLIAGSLIGGLWGLANAPLYKDLNLRLLHPLREIKKDNWDENKKGPEDWIALYLRLALLLTATLGFIILLFWGETRLGLSSLIILGFILAGIAWYVGKRIGGATQATVNAGLLGALLLGSCFALLGIALGFSMPQIWKKIGFGEYVWLRAVFGLILGGMVGASNSLTNTKSRQTKAVPLWWVGGIGYMVVTIVTTRFFGILAGIVAGLIAYAIPTSFLMGSNPDAKPEIQESFNNPRTRIVSGIFWGLLVGWMTPMMLVFMDLKLEMLPSPLNLPGHWVLIAMLGGALSGVLYNLRHRKTSTDDPAL